MKSFLRSRFFNEYGMVFVLLGLIAYFAAGTWEVQHPENTSAAENLAGKILNNGGTNQNILIVTTTNRMVAAFSKTLHAKLTAGGATVVETVSGEPSDLGRALQKLGKAGTRLDVLATHHRVAEWDMLAPKTFQTAWAKDYPSLKSARVTEPDTFMWFSFLTWDNLMDLLNQNADIAIMAIGMTLVIITAGIDLSVGKLLALSTVTTAWLIVNKTTGPNASLWALLVCGTAGVAACAALGTFSGVMVAVFSIPPFVITLSIMFIARGLAYLMTDAAAAIPVKHTSATWLGLERSFLGIPNAALLMLLLFIIAHVVMTHTRIGRHIYAVGGNPEAARLSGVSVKWVLVLVYGICGALAGLAGLVQGSRLSSGGAQFGEGYELSVIAAVVVGGTSLAGGEGRIMGTLIGTLIIGVIRKGMNMNEVEPFKQYIVFGALILAAVLLDQLKRRWRQSG
jgi:ribose transport system permease protein